MEMKDIKVGQLVYLHRVGLCAGSGSVGEKLIGLKIVVEILNGGKKLKLADIEHWRRPDSDVWTLVILSEDDMKDYENVETKTYSLRKNGHWVEVGKSMNYDYVKLNPLDFEI